MNKILMPKPSKHEIARVSTALLCMTDYLNRNDGFRNWIRLPFACVVVYVLLGFFLGVKLLNTLSNRTMILADVCKGVCIFRCVSTAFI